MEAQIGQPLGYDYNNGDTPCILNYCQLSFYGTAFDPQPGVPVVQPPVLVDVAEDDDAEDVGDDEPMNSVDDVEFIQDDSNVELFDLENVEEVTVPFDLSEKLEILNERRTE